MPNRPEKTQRTGPRKGGGRRPACDPDETITAKFPACAHCQADLTDADRLADVERRVIVSKHGQRAAGASSPRLGTSDT
jgi:hypothetical protein